MMDYTGTEGLESTICGELERVAHLEFRLEHLPSGSTRDRLREEVSTAMGNAMTAYSNLYAQNSQRVQGIDLEISRLCNNYPSHWFTVGQEMEKQGMLMQARNAYEHAAKEVDPLFWDHVAEVEEKLGNKQRADYIWRKRMEAWEGKGEHWYALKFAKRLGDEAAIARLQERIGQREGVSTEE